MNRVGKLIIVAVLVLASFKVSAEIRPQWSNGTMIGNAVIGTLPIGSSVSLDYVFVDEWWKGHFTVGGEIDFGVSSDDWKAIGITPRATYGLNITDVFEVHASFGLGLGVRIINNSEGKDDDSFVMWNQLVGCRFFITDDIAVLAETGYSNWFPKFRLGISYKF